MHAIQSVCVYAGASSTVVQRYQDVAVELAHILAANQVALIYGGGGVGLMGTLADACLDEGGQVVGIIPEFLYASEGVHRDGRELSELQVVGSMHERKCQMFERSDGFVLMPGGLGSLDEALEIITWKVLGLHAKPIVILNSYGYWNGLLEHQLPHMIDEGFVKETDKHLFEVCDQPKDVLETLKKMYRGSTNFVAKWG
jgi:uncharacterized protein (TIGR00730 family)